MNVLKKWWNKKPKPERTTPHTDKWHTIISASLTLLAISYFSAVHQDGFFSGFAVLFVSILGLSTGVGIARLQYRTGNWIPLGQSNLKNINVVPLNEEIKSLWEKNPLAVDCGSNSSDGPCFYNGPDGGVGSCIHHACLRISADIPSQSFTSEKEPVWRH